MTWLPYIQRTALFGLIALKYLDKTGATICGARPIGILMKIFEKDADAVLLNYTTSGEILGDFTDSVSYASILFTQSQ